MRREDGRTWFGKGYLRQPFVLDGDGCVQGPQRPGLGIELDDEGMARIMARPRQLQRG
jgi:galactonate dehydratase